MWAVGTARGSRGRTRQATARRAGGWRAALSAGPPARAPRAATGPRRDAIQLRVEAPDDEKRRARGIHVERRVGARGRVARPVIVGVVLDAQVDERDARLVERRVIRLGGPVVAARAVRVVVAEAQAHRRLGGHLLERRAQPRPSRRARRPQLVGGAAREHVEVHVQRELRARHRRCGDEGAHAVHAALLRVGGDEEDRVLGRARDEGTRDGEQRRRAGRVVVAAGPDHVAGAPHVVVVGGDDEHPVGGARAAHRADHVGALPRAADESLPPRAGRLERVHVRGHARPRRGEGHQAGLAEGAGEIAPRALAASGAEAAPLHRVGGERPEVAEEAHRVERRRLRDGHGRRGVARALRAVVCMGRAPRRAGAAKHDGGGEGEQARRGQDGGHVRGGAVRDAVEDAMQRPRRLRRSLQHRRKRAPPESGTDARTPPPARDVGGGVRVGVCVSPQAGQSSRRTGFRFLGHRRQRQNVTGRYR
jgi:hypothetical protein